MKIRRAGDAVVISIDVYNLNFSEAGKMKSTVQSVMDTESTRTLVLDFSRVEFVDSLGIGAIASIAVKMRKNEGELRIAGTTSIVKTALEAVNLQQLVGFYPDVDAATRGEGV